MAKKTAQTVIPVTVSRKAKAFGHPRNNVIIVKIANAISSQLHDPKN
jgi:hypothetical protein